jgi:threonine synthase
MTTIECLDCGHKTHFTPAEQACPNCGGGWREARYDLGEIGPRLPALAASRPNDLWRFREVLPVVGPNPDLTMGEGGTPMIHAANLGMMLGNPNIYIKDERQGPTASFKDRQAALSITALKEAGINEAVLASTGNVAISYSAYAARASIKLWAFLTSLVPAEKMREVAIYGTQVVKVTASYDQAKAIAAEFAKQRGLYLERGSASITSVEAMKTLSYEIVEQLGHIASALPRDAFASPAAGQGGSPWRAPDWYVQAVSGGLGPQGVLKGFEELRQMGLIDRIPALAAIQTEGCAPMVHAFNQNVDVAEPVQTPRTHIATLSTGNPGRTYTWLRQHMNPANGGGGGVFESVTDEEAFRTIHMVAKMEGLSVEPATAVAFAGVIKLIRRGIIRPTDVVVINCTGHTMPIEKEILGENWAKNVVVSSKALQETPEEGLLSALTRVTSERYSRILVADDTADARRLILRILQSQGEYTLFEAVDGPQTVDIARREIPDLIILDLMMPGLDGFGVLEALQEIPETAEIPVIVVTAKDLTPQEKSRLEGRIHTLMQKGSFLTDELADEVRALLR